MRKFSTESQDEILPICGFYRQKREAVKKIATIRMIEFGELLSMLAPHTGTGSEKTAQVRCNNLCKQHITCMEAADSVTFGTDSEGEVTFY